GTGPTAASTPAASRPQSCRGGWQRMRSRNHLRWRTSSVMTTPEGEKERIKRPKLERTEPIRSWSALLGVPGAGGGDGRAPGSASLEGVVSRSVELGYRVVEDYLRQGQRVAAGIV